MYLRKKMQINQLINCLKTKKFSKWIGDKKSIINAEKEVIGTGLDFKKMNTYDGV